MSPSLRMPCLITGAGLEHLRAFLSRATALPDNCSDCGGRFIAAPGAAAQGCNKCGLALCGSCMLVHLGRQLYLAQEAGRAGPLGNGPVIIQMHCPNTACDALMLTTPAQADPADPTTKKGCMRCGAAGAEGSVLPQCAACLRAKYCSRECQKADWPAHKAVCRMYRSVPKAPAL